MIAADEACGAGGRTVRFEAVYVGTILLADSVTKKGGRTAEGVLGEYLVAYGCVLYMCIAGGGS